MKQLYILVSCIFLASCTSTNNKQSNNLIEPERLQLMKDYAFCKCLEYALGEKIYNQIDELDLTKAMIFDVADLWGRYSLLDSMALDASSKISVSQISDFGNAKPILFDCLQFHRSEELDAFVKTIK